VEVEHVLRDFGLIPGAGLLAQLVATFMRIPEMIVLVAVGALIGPSVLGIAENPLNGVGAQLIFTVGMAMILFHGGVGISTFGPRRRGRRDHGLAGGPRGLALPSFCRPQPRATWPGDSAFSKTESP
jgi:NhaP-type Na+/H+ or K+/H+ antiporter